MIPISSMIYEEIRVIPSGTSPYYLISQSYNKVTGFCRKSSNIISNSKLEDLFDHLANGGYVLDKRGIKTTVIKNIWIPKLDTQLNPLTISVSGEYPRYKKTFKSIQQGISYIIYNKINNSNIQDDSISIDLYCAIWNCLGANVGRKISNQIYWKSPYKGPSIF